MWPRGIRTAIGVFRVPDTSTDRMTEQLTDEDRGKQVVHETERIGVVTDVRGDTATVDPQWNHVHDELRAELGWDPDDEHQTLDESLVTDVRNGQVHLRDDIL